MPRYDLLALARHGLVELPSASPLMPDKGISITSAKAGLLGPACASRLVSYTSFPRPYYVL